jgi:hypothetical protein
VTEDLHRPAAAPSPLPTGGGNATSTPRNGARRIAAAPRPALVVALALSLALHGALSLWPSDLQSTPETLPLQASIVEMPPPPMPAPRAAAKPRPKPQRPTAQRPHVEPSPAPVAEVVAAKAPEAQLIEPTAEAIAMGPEPATEVVAEASVPPEHPPKTLPRRVDLVYKAFLGTQGFLVGEAVYRFEHAGGEYHIVTIGEAKGLAALFLRGQGRLESRGLISSTGLRPYEFAVVVERGSRERRERAVFDWEAGVVTLSDDRTEPIEPSTFDPMSLMWQAYFTPPVDDVQEITVATTRRVGRHTLTRDGDETIAWGQGDIVTERWRRMSEDGNTETTAWLAPSLRYVPVKMRVVTNYKSLLGATLEARLDSIRVDEPLAQQ